MKLGSKYAKQYGYDRFVGSEITPVKDITVDVNGELQTFKRVTIKVSDVPFPLSLDIHPEDILDK
jgi:hypothetical protein